MVDFQGSLQGEVPTNEEIIKEIEADNEKQYLKELKKKNKEYLIENLTILERERIAQFICDRYNEALPKHNELSDKIDKWDEVYRMERQEVIGSGGDMPNYRTPLSTVSLEVIHANEMNVFFTPKDIMRPLPTEEGDIAKVKKLGVFGNWSMKNELDLFAKIDQLFHNADKVGECPYIVHWVKEYGTEIKRELIPNPANPGEPMYDPDTQEVLYQEVEEQKLLYNGPKLEIFSRKDYIQPPSALMGKVPSYEIRKIRITYDEYLREMLQGKMYAKTIHEITDWSSEDSAESNKEDYEGDSIPLGQWEKEFIEVYIRMRIKLIKNDDESEVDEFEELEDEFIATVNVNDKILCSLRKNKFPLKMRPIGLDYFIPDDEGRRSAIGVMEFLDSLQKGYDALFNQYVFGTIQSNNPTVFTQVMGNMKDAPIKIKNGYIHPMMDTSGLKFLQVPAPNATIHIVLELINQWSQLLFGISDYASGVESKIDPDAPAKKAEIVVAQGNVRMNMIIKRKNETLKDIFKRWFLLYKDNMPPNKFMRIAGHSEENPWKFEAVTMEDFALKSLPDFELTGNILNVNKTLEANKKLAIYNLLVQNVFFAPQSSKGLQALHSLTKWLIDGLEETGLSRFLPEAPGEMVNTPEEENARFLQGDSGEPTPNEDHVAHMKVHQQFVVDPTIPEELRQAVAGHISKHIEMLRAQVTQQLVLTQAGIDPQSVNQGGNGGQGTVPEGQTPGAANRVFPGKPQNVV